MTTTLTIGQEVTLISGQLATVQQLMDDGQVKVRFICDTCSLTVTADKIRPVIAKNDGPKGCAKAILGVLIDHECGFGFNNRAPDMDLDKLTDVVNAMRPKMLHILAEYRHTNVAGMRAAVVGLTGFMGCMVGLKCIDHLKAACVGACA